jgi:hypothetical protein
MYIRVDNSGSGKRLPASQHCIIAILVLPVLIIDSYTSKRFTALHKKKTM